MANGTETVEVYNPKGVYGTIPASQLEQAKSAGYKPKSDFVEAVHPKTGQTGIIPKAQWEAAQKQGYAMSPREQQRVKAKAGEAIKPLERTMALPIGTGAMGAQVTGTPEQLKPAQQSMDALAIGTASTLGGGAAGAGIGKLLAPVASTEMIATGIFGPNGEEIMREGLKYGPSAVSKAISSPVAQQILKLVGKGVKAAGAWEALKALGLLKK
jgi:hypothetical protein